MAKESGSFRGKLFGGFDRRDVSDYIEKIAAERNKYKKELNAMTGRVEELEQKLNAAEAELEISRQTEESRRLEFHEEAAGIARTMRERFETINGEVSDTMEHIRCGMTTISDSLIHLTGAMSDARDQFEELEESISLDPEDDADVSEDAGILSELDEMSSPE